MATMKYEWTLKSGKKGILEATYSEEVQDQIAYADGYNIPTGKKEIVEKGNLVCYIDGKKIDSCWDTAFWQIIDIPQQPGIKRIWGLERVGFDAQHAAEVEKFLHEVIEAGKDADAEAIRKAEAEKKMLEEVEEAKETIRKAEAQKDIPSREEAKRRMKRYNDVMNDGGYGFVPYIISREEYEAAKAIVARAERNEQ